MANYIHGHICHCNMRFKFLMNKFGPGNRLEKEKVI